MGLKTTCDGCGTAVIGVLSSLKKVDNRYLCSSCQANPNNNPKYYCNSCHNLSPTALRKGSTLIEIVLYLAWIIPGIIYSIWRRGSAPNVCPLCKKTGLVPSANAKPTEITNQLLLRDEVDCPHCAEKILVKANICKHCGKQVRTA